MKPTYKGLWTYLILGLMPIFTAGALARAASVQRLGLRSPKFKNGKEIPAKYTCLGQNVSPPLNWSGVPAQAKFLALIVDDPDAPEGTWTHWLVYGLPAKLAALPEGDKPKAREGRNSFGTLGYGGPCPPAGPAHHYHFKLYALDAGFSAPSQADEQALVGFMKGHIIGQAELTGLFARP